MYCRLQRLNAFKNTRLNLSINMYSICCISFPPPMDPQGGIPYDHTFWGGGVTPGYCMNIWKTPVEIGKLMSLTKTHP